MTLIKCNHCGRPFYDSEKACPFCGHASSLSVNNRITKAISNPQSHKLMEDFFAGNIQHPQIRPAHNSPNTKTIEPVIEPKQDEVKTSLIVDQEPQTVYSEPVVEPETVQPSEAVLDRAESIAAATANASVNNEPTGNEEPNEVETELPRKKRHGWVWIIILVILLAIAAAVYLKWDFVYEKVTSILN